MNVHPHPIRPEKAAPYAMLCAAALLAQQVASKAARDALYLSSFPVTTLPIMLMGAAAFSIVMVLVTSRAMVRYEPAWLVPRALLGSAILLVGEWALAGFFPRLAAVVVYLHVASLGSLLISGFWSVVNECFDPRAAKAYIARITVAAALGGLLGGFLADRVAAYFPILWILPILALLHLYSGGMMLRLRPPPSILNHSRPEEPQQSPTMQGIRVLRSTPYLRNLGLLVFLGTASAALLDYVFKARATATVDSGADLLRFFAIFHTVVGFGTFLVQGAASRISMEHLGLSGRVTAYPLAIGAGSLGALFSPGVLSAAVARGAQQLMQNSLFRSGYETLFTPVSQRDKRASKAILDVGYERAGDAVGAACVRGLLFLPVPFSASAMLGVAASLGLFGIIVARRLRRGYMRQLEQRLMSGVFQLDPSAIDDPLTRSMILGSVSTHKPPQEESAAETDPSRPAPVSSSTEDVLMQRIEELRSGDPARVSAALAAGPIDPELASHVVPLLAWDSVYPYAARSLKASRERIEGQLVDRLLDHNEEFAIRRRIPALLADSRSRVVIEGLLQGLLDRRFEVRFRCGRTLAHIHDQDPSVPIDRHRVFAIASRETRVDRGVWESQRLLDHLEDLGDEPFVDEYLRQRANRSLEHVFTVLSLALDKKPLQVAFRGLHTDDPILRGTALEYLESALPEDLRLSLWPFLEARPGSAPPTRTRDEILDSLMNSHQSIEINLAKLRQRMQDRS
jgi:hypothetical protein